MLYGEDRKGNRISRLGYGCMRFSRRGGGLDLEKAERELMTAYERGVNYFDTAYVYPGSEDLLGEVLERNGIRNDVNVATKLPQYMTRSMKSVDRIFAEERRRLRTDRIDYYLMHMFTDVSEWEKLCSMGMEEWIIARKREGSVGSIGFSYHGETEMFLRILNAYDWDFCQIQYNYLDENSQAGRRGLEAAYEKGVPVIIMEPLRGGKLVRLPSPAEEILNESGRGWSNAEWGLRWLWDQPGVTCVLSGMNSVEMVEENARIASDAAVGTMTDADRALLERAVRVIRERDRVGCTGCRYCMPCPSGVDIPGNFYYYNLMYVDRKSSARFEFAQAMGMRKEPGFATQCVGCGKCEKHCPQHLSIRAFLKEADAALRPLPYRIGIDVARRFITRG